MAERAMQHRRTHNLLLFQRLLSLREGSSPFTLVLDSLEQSGKSLIAEYVRHAKVR
jgi:elongator complex protein 5